VGEMRIKIRLPKRRMQTIEDIEVKEVNIYNYLNDDLEILVSLDSLNRLYLTIRSGENE